MTIGSILNDRYLLQSELGRGGMGVVYRARDTLLERDVAVKVVAGTGLGTEGRDRLLQEARAAARLSHPHIVAVYDVGQSDGAAFIVMEVVAGHSLREHQSQDLADMLDITEQICLALEAARERGVIHRDLKPENVLVDRMGVVKLMDFGLARVTGRSRLTREGALMGTFNYLAPEIIMGHEASHQSDLYALGVMLYELVAGRRPFAGESATAVLSQHIYAPVVPPSTYDEKIPPALDALIIQLLRKEPGDRPASAAEVREALRGLDRAAETHFPGPVSHLQRLVRGRLVGREREFAQAVAIWEQAAAGQGRVLTISGEPGIGKTRLARELSTYVEATGGRVLAGACYEQGAVPYLPISQMVRAALADGHPHDLTEPALADLLAIAPDLRGQLPLLPAGQSLEPEAEKLRLFESVVILCQSITSQAPLMLLVDDLHWADSGSLALLSHLVRRTQDQPLLLAVTYRELELSERRPARQMLRDLNRERSATRLKLPRLDKEQTREMLVTLFAEEIDADFSDGIFLETEGNPFFIEEVSRALIESGKVYFAGGHWHRPEMERLEIPEGVQLAIESRLERLDEEALAVLQIAALLGRDFRYEMLAAASQLPEGSLIDALEHAERIQIIQEIRPAGLATGRTAFSFSHALIHSTLLAHLSTLRRQRLQRQVAFALEEALPAELDELAPLLGRYFAEAGEGQKAVHYLLLAGDAARQLFAYHEAIEAYQQALLFLRDGDEAELTARTLMKLGLVYQVTHAFDQARLAHEEAFAIRQRTGMERVQAGLPLAAQPLRLWGFKFRAPDPALTGTGESEFMVQHLFAGLVTLMPDGGIEPDAAISWDQLEGGKRYIFHLRDDIRWSDGRAVTAHDFEFGWKRALEPLFGENPANLFYDIAGARAFNQGQSAGPEAVGVRAINDRTLAVELEAPASTFLQILAMGVAKPVPRHQVSALGAAWNDPQKIVTNGPFKIKEWRPSGTSVLERNPAYRGPALGNVGCLELINVSFDQVFERYEANEIDVVDIDHLSEPEFARAMHRHPDEYASGPYPNTIHIWFDTVRPPFDDARVRRALALATDRDMLVKRSAPGRHDPASGGFVPPGIPGHVPDIAPAADPQQARALLADAGYPEGQAFPAVDLVTAHSSPHLEATAVELKRQWQEILGIHCELIYLPMAEFRERWLTKPPHIWLMGWTADYPDADNFLRSASWRPISRWRHAAYEELVEGARRISEPSERQAMYREAELILIEEAPLIPIYYDRYFILVKPWLKNYSMTMSGLIQSQHLIIEPME